MLHLIIQVLGHLGHLGEGGNTARAAAFRAKCSACVQVKAEQEETETIFAAREAAEAAGAGRIPMEAFKAVTSTLQARHRPLATRHTHKAVVMPHVCYVGSWEAQRHPAIPEASPASPCPTCRARRSMQSVMRQGVHDAAQAAGALCKAGVLAVQAQGRSPEAVAAVAAKHGCTAEQLNAVLQHTSVPAIHTGLVDGKHALVAVWQ